MNSHRPTATYEEFAPDPELQHWVAYSWRFRAVEGGRHPIPPETGFTVSAIPDLGFVSLRGPHDRAIEVDAPPGLEVVGIRLWPGTISGLDTRARIDPVEWVGREEPAEAWLPSVTASMLRAIAGADGESDHPVSSTERFTKSLDRALVDVDFEPRRLDHDILVAVFRLLAPAGAATVTDLADELHLSTRQFRRRFRRAVGLSPRAFRRARRIRLALEQAVLPSGATWIDLAGTHGYADQAHLCREFRRTTGRSPGVYVEAVRHIEHHLTGDRNVQYKGATRS